MLSADLREEFKQILKTRISELEHALALAEHEARDARAREKYYAKAQIDTGAARAPSASPPATTKPSESDAPRRERKPKLLVKRDQP